MSEKAQIAEHKMEAIHEVHLVRGGKPIVVSPNKAFMATSQERKELTQRLRPAAKDFEEPSLEVLGSTEEATDKPEPATAEQKAEAKTLGLKGYTKLSKADLQQLIDEAKGDAAKDGDDII